MGSSASISKRRKQEEEELPPIVFFDLDDMKSLGEFPRSPEHKHLQTKLDDINRDDAVFIFVSHCWLRGWNGAEGWDGRPHPDTPQHDKMKLIIEACDKMKKTFYPGVSKAYLWLDYGCIDQDATACLELKMLDKIIQVCDLVVTPIYEKDVGDWYGDIVKKGISNMFDQYGSPAWKEGDHSYVNRAWCRVEMMYATNIPLLESSPERLSRFSGLLQQRRLHVIYGSNEQKRRMQPVVLPPLNNSWFDMYTPESGKLTKESDRVHVKLLVDAIRGSIERTEEKYEGEYNEEGKRHGKGKYTYANGNVYEGDFQDGKRHGKGKFTYASGSVYEGDWKDDNFHGKGKYTFANGNVYEGDYQDGKRHGKGKYTSADGTVYEGDFQDGKRNGKGIERRSDGTIVHDGDWKDDKACVSVTST